MMNRMMDGMTWPMWAMAMGSLLTIIVLVLAAAALGKYFFTGKRADRDGR